MCLAKDTKSKMPTIKFNNETFSLYYSTKTPEKQSYFNEYYKTYENYANWTELISVHNYPNAYSPIEQAKLFRDYLGEMNCPSALDIDEENNSATLDFILINNKKLPIILEFNIFKYEKSPICGTNAIQYARRYRINNSLEIDTVKKSFQKKRDNYLKQIKRLEIPSIVQHEVDKGKYINTEGIIENGLNYLN
jgi:hypothetical protein